MRIIIIRKGEIVMKVDWTMGEVNQIIRESVIGKIDGTLELGITKSLISALARDDFDKPYYTKPPDGIKFLNDGIVEFNIGSCDPNNIGRNLYKDQYALFTPNEINTLIGCNSSGKSTMLRKIEEILYTNGFPYILYDNIDNSFKWLHERIHESIHYRNLSEGEVIAKASSKYINVLTDIIVGTIIRDKKFRKYRDLDNIFLLLDSIDTGYSIDNILNLTGILNGLICLAKKNKKRLYIIAAANNFEFIQGNRSWDVQASKEIFFNKYEEYKQRIIETSEPALE